MSREPNIPCYSSSSWACMQCITCIPCYFSSSWTIYDMFSLLFLFQYMTCILCYFSSSWACVQCKAPYDMDEIEDTLLDAIHRKSMAFILQDLKCVKCNGVRYFIIRHKMNRLAIIANDSFSCIYTEHPGFFFTL